MRLMMSAVLALVVAAVAAPVASAAPWQCDSTGYVVQYGGDFGSESVFGPFNRQADGSYNFTELGSWPYTGLNAIGFRPQDGYMYAWDNSRQSLVRIERDPATGNAIFTNLTVSGLPNFGAWVGAFLNDGTFFMWGTTADPRGYIIDVTGPTPRVISTVTKDAAWDYAAWPLGDFAVSPVDGRIYANVSGQVRELVLSGTAPNMTFSLGPIVSAGGPGSGGAQWFEPRGAAGTLLQIAGTELWATDIAAGTTVSWPLAQVPVQGDGTSCPNTMYVTKDATPRTVSAGEELTYTYTITARGLVDNPVDFVDTLPAGMTYVAGGVTVNGTFGSPNAYAGTDTLRISGVIPRNTTVTITARVKVASSAACFADVPNQAEATMHAAGLPDVTVRSDDPTTPTDPTDPTVVRVNCNADLRIEKTAGSARYQPGGQLAYTLTATNHGPSDAANPVVRDTLPAGLSVVSVDPQCTVSGQTVTCTLPTLAAGAAHRFNITTRVATSATGCLRNEAVVSSSTPDPNSANNATSMCVPPMESDVRIVKTSSTSPVVPGEDVVYRLTVSNNGPDTALDVVVTDRLPSALRFVSVSRGCTQANGTITCTIASLAAGASESFTITTRAPSSLKGCPRNTATVRSLTVDTDLTNNADSACPPIRGKTDLSIVKTAATDSVQAGGQVMYTLVVRNNGPSDATGVIVEDPLATGLTLVSAQPGQGACSVTDGRVACNLGDLDAGGSTQILVTATAPTTATCPVNTATVSGDQQDTNQRNNSSSARICTTVTVVDPRFDLVIQKTVKKSALLLGQNATYTLKVTNKGPDAATNVRVTDTFNAKGTLVSVKPTVGRCVKKMPITCSLGTMRAGATATITVVIKPTTVGRGQDNTASVTGDGRDENPRDNIDGAIISVKRVDLALTKGVNRTVLQAGQTATYTIRVANTTKATVRNVRVCDDLPEGLAFVSATPKATLRGGQFCWTPIKQLAPGRSRTYKMTVRALRGTFGRKVNTATATSPDANTKRARRVVRVIGGAIKGGGVTG